jgi:hypothetical protein
MSHDKTKSRRRGPRRLIKPMGTNAFISFTHP